MGLQINLQIDLSSKQEKKNSIFFLSYAKVIFESQFEAPSGPMTRPCRPAIHSAAIKAGRNVSHVPVFDYRNFTNIVNQEENDYGPKKLIRGSNEFNIRSTETKAQSFIICVHTEYCEQRKTLSRLGCRYPTRPVGADNVLCYPSSLALN